MRKFLFLFFLVALIATSCVMDNSTSDVLHNSTGTVSFSTDMARGISASIEYPSLLDKVWVLTATKTDNGNTEGSGTYDDFILTDTLTLSVGSWRFTITDSSGSITGSVDAIIKVGSNLVSIAVHSTASKGTLSIEDCSFLVSKIGRVNYVDCYVDDARMNGTEWVISESMSEDGDYYVLPTISLQLSEGIHSVRLYFGMDNGGQSSDTVNIRVVKGMVTHLTIGEQDGNLSVTVYFEQVEAIYED